MRIVAPAEREELCLSDQHRRCPLFREFLETLAERPERWRTTDVGAGRAPRRRAEGT